jgi:hypothetical protein
MRRLLVFLTAVFFGLHSYAQSNVYVLHPLVGDTIDNKEKLQYLLFKNVNDSDFKYGVITHTKDAYFLKVCSANNSVSTIQVDSTELKQYVEKLDKVAAYYANEGKKDSIKSNLKLHVDEDDPQVKNLNSTLINQQSKNKILKEARTQTRMKEDAERYKNRNDHSNLFSGAGHVEFPTIKTKKRK